MNDSSFVLYESVYKQAQILEKRVGADAAMHFMNAIMEFGLYGVIPEEDDEVWLYGFEQTITSIDRAKKRHIQAVEGGKKGGRPAIEIPKDEIIQKKAELKTWIAVAAYFGIDVDTLRKIRKNYGI